MDAEFVADHRTLRKARQTERQPETKRKDEPPGQIQNGASAKCKMAADRPSHCFGCDWLVTSAAERRGLVEEGGT